MPYVKNTNRSRFQNEHFKGQFLWLDFIKIPVKCGKPIPKNLFEKYRDVLEKYAEQGLVQIICGAKPQSVESIPIESILPPEPVKVSEKLAEQPKPVTKPVEPTIKPKPEPKVEPKVEVKPEPVAEVKPVEEPVKEKKPKKEPKVDPVKAAKAALLEKLQGDFKLNKKELQQLCDENGIEYAPGDTKAILLNKLTEWSNS